MNKTFVGFIFLLFLVGGVVSCQTFLVTVSVFFEICRFFDGDIS